MGQQMKALTQDYGQIQKDYTSGIATTGRQTDISRAGVAAGQKTAEETYALGMKGQAADYTHATNVADLDFRKGIYTEQQKQLDDYWEMMGLRTSV